MSDACNSSPFQVVYVQRPRMRGSSRSRKVSPSVLSARTSAMMARPGIVATWYVDGDELPAVAEHRAPVGLRGLCAESKKRQSSRLGDHPANIQRQQHQQRRHDVGKDVLAQDAELAGAGGARGVDIRLTAHGQDVAPYVARIKRDVDHRDGDHRVDQARPETRPPARSRATRTGRPA